jgi:hypothetical protein
MSVTCNYPPNEKPLNVGSLVVHDCDEKGPRMIGEVVKRHADGRVDFIYIHPAFPGYFRKGWTSTPHSLFPIEEFGFVQSRDGGDIVLDFDPAATRIRYKDGIVPYICRPNEHLRFTPVRTGRRIRPCRG